jgi:lysylphosphatidylglycerol synthetase-like protein (DUF2156 family)
VLSLHAVLPLSVLIDGKVNPEGPHATLYMLAAYWLWRIEQQASGGLHIWPRTAITFGILAGLAVLTKGTSAVLMLTAALVLGWQSARSQSLLGWRATWSRLIRPAAIAGLMFCIVAGWWLVPNIVKHGHPFPHVWDLEVHPELQQPALYRRPLGWALPFDWVPYFDLPIISSLVVPRPNFWSVVITGTWTDFYNRGFCRLSGGLIEEHVWGGRLGFMSDPLGGWGVSSRCIPIFRALLGIGLPVTFGCVLGVLYTAWLSIRTYGRRGTLVLPLCVGFGTLFIMMFALVYPFDNSAVLNPRYLLPVQTPMLACAGIGLARLEASRIARRPALVCAFLSVGAIATLLLYERFAG